MLWASWQWQFTIIIVNSDLRQREPEIMFEKRRRLQNMIWGMQQTEVKHCGNTSNVLCTKAFWVIPCKKCIADKPAKKIQHTQALSNKLTQLSLTECVALTRKYPRDSNKCKKLGDAVVEMIITHFQPSLIVEMLDLLDTHLCLKSLIWASQQENHFEEMKNMGLQKPLQQKLQNILLYLLPLNYGDLFKYYVIVNAWLWCNMDLSFRLTW